MNRRDARIDLAVRTAFMAVIYLVFALQLPNYHTSNGIAALLDGAVLIGIVSVGVGVTMIAGEFDLSVGSLAALTGVISLEIIGIGVLPALVVGVLFAAAVGVIQGLLIGVLGINSLVFTIGTLIGLRGLAMVVAHEQTITMPIEQLPDVDILTQHFLGVFSPISVGMIVVFVAVGLFLKYTLWGREIYAIGGGRNEARAAGVPLLRPMMIAFTLSGALAGLGGALLSIRLGSATPLGFDSLLLSAATTCLMGGIALEGGNRQRDRDRDRPVHAALPSDRHGRPGRALLCPESRGWRAVDSGCCRPAHPDAAQKAPGADAIVGPDRLI